MGEKEKKFLQEEGLRQNRIEYLKQYTEDKTILAASGSVAFTQEELEGLLGIGVKEIYLCGRQFILPGSMGGITYKGINHPMVKVDGDMIEAGIDFHGLEFDISIYLDYGSSQIKFCDFFAKNKELGIKMLHIADKNGSMAAQVALGDCYRQGYGVRKDLKEAIRRYRKPAEKGYAAAQMALGDCYGRRYSAGLASKEGLIGEIWYVMKRKEAMKWYRKAAGQGYAAAQVALGDCYKRGYGIRESPGEAVRWYWKAARQGYATAQIALGDCLMSGYGIKKDLRAAVSWYQKAAEQGDGLAKYKLDVLPDEDKMVDKPEKVRDEKI